MDNYKELQDKYEITIQENASLKFELQDLMERNVALQKAFLKVGKEVPQVSPVNYVENVIFIFYIFNVIIFEIFSSITRMMVATMKAMFLYQLKIVCC